MCALNVQCTYSLRIPWKLYYENNIDILSVNNIIMCGLHVGLPYSTIEKIIFMIMDF